MLTIKLCLNCLTWSTGQIIWWRWANDCSTNKENEYVCWSVRSVLTLKMGSHNKTYFLNWALGNEFCFIFAIATVSSCSVSFRSSSADFRRATMQRSHSEILIKHQILLLVWNFSWLEKECTMYTDFHWNEGLHTFSFEYKILKYKNHWMNLFFCFCCRISKNIPTTKDVEPLLEIDGDIRSFEVFLSSRTPVLTVHDVEMFLPCTVNLDPKLREIIAGLQTPHCLLQ